MEKGIREFAFRGKTRGNSSSFLHSRRLVGGMNAAGRRADAVADRCGMGSDAPPCGVPDEFVHLKLETDPEPVAQDPFREQIGGHASEDGGEQDLSASGRKIAAFGQFRCPQVIFFVGDDEFHLVPPGKLFDIRVPVFFHHPGTGALHVHDPDDPGIDARNVDMAAGFHRDDIALVAETGHEGEAFRLFERFSPREFNE